MPGPGDALEVINALRLGWYVAEVRGRSRPGGPRPPGDELPSRGDHVLPLRIERTAPELRTEAQAILHKLSGDLGVDAVTDHDPAQSRTAVIGQQADALAAAEPQSAAAVAAWQALTASLYQLDAHAQDTLTAESDLRAAAYQLGRGLAEMYWALDPDAACDPLMPECWTFLLGAHRCEELTRLVGRLSGYLNPYCPPAVAGTLRRWYELLVLGQDPSTLIRPYALLKNWHATVHALRALRVQLVTAAISLVLVIAVIALISNGSANALLKALLGVVGVVGLSAATVWARLKTTAQGVIARFRQDAYTDLVAVAIAEAPDKPGARSPREVVVEEVRKRTLTTIADATVP